VATMIARHFRCGDSGCMPAGGFRLRDAGVAAITPSPLHRPGSEASDEIALQ
jgi:hypothetical protein